MDCTPPGNSLARILEWVSIPFFWASSWPRDWTHVPWRFCTAKPPGKPLSQLISWEHGPENKVGRVLFDSICLKYQNKQTYRDSRCWMPWGRGGDGERLLHGRGCFFFPFIRTLVPFRGAPPSWPNHVLRPHLKYHDFGSKFQQEFWEGTCSPLQWKSPKIFLNKESH